MANAICNISKRDMHAGGLGLPTSDPGAGVASGWYAALYDDNGGASPPDLTATTRDTAFAPARIVGSWVQITRLWVQSDGQVNVEAVTLGAGTSTTIENVVIARGNASGSLPYASFDRNNSNAAFSLNPGAGGITVSFPTGLAG